MENLRTEDKLGIDKYEIVKSKKFRIHDFANNSWSE